MAARLAKKDLLAELSDKDGVFVIARREVLNDLIFKEFGKPWCRPAGLGNLEPWFRSVQKGLSTLAPSFGRFFAVAGPRGTNPSQHSNRE